jgi:lauroyl/myristoyl acyltransferase
MIQQTTDSRTASSPAAPAVQYRDAAWASELLGGAHDADTVRDTIARLDESALEPLGLGLFYMNLLAALGDRVDPGEVRRLALAAARTKLWRGWEFYHGYMSSLGHDPAVATEPRLLDFDPERLRSLLAGGKGLMVCSFHLGDYRHLPTDMALAGLGCTLPLDTRACSDYRQAIAATGEERIRLVQAVDVEEPGGARALAKALAKHELVFAYVDGNTGTDGPMGDQARTEIEFLGYPVRVKNGLMRLAARFGTPILPVYAVRRGGSDQRDPGTWVAGEVLEPGGALRGEAQESFVREALEHLYRFFETGVREAPEQWETACFYHRWRAGTAPRPIEETPADVARRRLEEGIAGGRVLRLDRRWVAEVRRGGASAWADVRTMRAFEVPAERRSLLDRLAADAGVDREWLAAHGGAADDALELLAPLAGRGLITVEDRRAGSPAQEDEFRGDS